MSRQARRRRFSNWLLLAWLLVGTLDMADAITFFGLQGVRPSSIPQSIAAAFMGRSAFRMGWKTVVIGLAVHFVIALVLTLVYFLADRSLRLDRYAVIAGLVYGAAAYCVINTLLPLTRTPPQHFPTGPVLLNGLFAHLFLVGLPIALCSRRANTT